jgi:lysophospholipase L1-like esterase
MKSVGSILAATFGLVALTGACSDSRLPTEIPISREVTPLASQSGGARLFHRYVAIGTSITMGVQSDGVFSETQKASWVAQLAGLAEEEISLPLIQWPGCGSPLKSPLRFGTRLSDESAAVGESRICAELEPGITLPTANVAIDGARTDDALFSKVGTYSGYRGGQYARVLPPAMSQVDAMLAQNPKFVSVELGGNDVMGARIGIYAPVFPGGTVVPLEQWKGYYKQVLDAVQSTAKRAILVGLIDDALEFPGFRTGQEIWDARVALLQNFYVQVLGDCEGSRNVLFVPVRIPGAIAEGAKNFAEKKAPARLSCVNVPSSTGVRDFVLAPEEIAALNAHLAAMNAFIRQQAAARGFAYTELEVIYGRSDGKPAVFDPVQLMTSGEPYGPYVSLDGIHPSTAGSRLLAQAAAAAINQRYHTRIGEPRDPTVADENEDDDKGGH